MTCTTDSPKLSPRMRDLCRAVETLTEKRGIPPSMTEVARELRVHPSRVQQLAIKAAARGAIVREAGIPRSLRVNPNYNPSSRNRTRSR
jgi:hypothetical protein